jgi:hypothetical protein
MLEWFKKKRPKQRQCKLPYPDMDKGGSEAFKALTLKVPDEQKEVQRSEYPESIGEILQRKYAKPRYSAVE